MKAVIAEIPQFIIEWRRRTGAERWDEMWEGVLHMGPAPSLEHQDLAGDLERWLRAHWSRARRNKVYHDVSVASEGNWPDDYRIPDLVLLMGNRLRICRGDYLDGAPDVVIEILSPNDETREKMPFYARIGVPEVWLVDGETRQPEIHVLRGDGYQPLSTDTEGWFCSPATGIRLRRKGKQLVIQLQGDANTRAKLPGD
jgi:Uma2 family endonuclease